MRRMFRTALVLAAWMLGAACEAAYCLFRL